MLLEEDQLYHIFNRGNNSCKIFFEKKNYKFFKAKIKTFISPYSSIIAWCLMPNHFHIMLEIKKLFIEKQSLNSSIGQMLSSYTRAINKQEHRTGSLFQKQTKAICLTTSKIISPSWFDHPGYSSINIRNPEHEYPTICMKYIHNNPVYSGLVKEAEYWEYSSYIEYLNPGINSLIDLDKGLPYFKETYDLIN